MSALSSPPSTPTLVAAGRDSPKLTYAQILVKSISSSGSDRECDTDSCGPPGRSSTDVAVQGTDSTSTTDFNFDHVGHPGDTTSAPSTPILSTAGDTLREEEQPNPLAMGSTTSTNDDPSSMTDLWTCQASDLGKRSRISSPTQSMRESSPPLFSKIPRKQPRGWKAARTSSRPTTPGSRITTAPHTQQYQSTPSPPVTPVLTAPHSTRVHDGQGLRRSVSSPGLAETVTDDGSPGRNSDVSMRTASPLEQERDNNRIPTWEKGKNVARQPTPGPSRPPRTFDTFLDYEEHDPTVFRVAPPSPPANFRPNDSTYSVYPPIPHHYREEFPFRTPIPHNGFRRDDRRHSAQSSFSTPSQPHPHDQHDEDKDLRPEYPDVDHRTHHDSQSSRLLGLGDFVQQLERYAPNEHDDFLTFTPTPPGGFPSIHMSTPLGFFDNIDDKQLLDWERERAKGRIVVGISFYGHGALDGEIDPRHKQLLSYASHLLNARFHTNRIMIASPKPKTLVTSLNSAPYTALVYGVNDEEALTLLEEGVMATPRLGMFFHKLDIVFPSFVGAIHGLTTRLIHPVYELVVAHFITTEADQIFRELTMNTPNPAVSPDDAQIHFVNSLYVRRLDCRARGNTLAPVFLIYIASPAYDYLSHRAWMSFCKTMNLSHSLYGSGRLQSPGTCAGCHGHDHPSGLCRFPQVDKWCAPAPFSQPNFAIPSISSTLLPQQSTMPARSQTTRSSRGGPNDRGRRRRGDRRRN